MVPVACSWKLCNIRLAILLMIFATSNCMSLLKIYGIYINEWGRFLNKTEIRNQTMAISNETLLQRFFNCK